MEQEYELRLFGGGVGGGELAGICDGSLMFGRGLSTANKKSFLKSVLSLALCDVLTRGERRSDSALLYAALSQVWY